MQLIDQYYQLLTERNKVCNLTRIIDYQDFLYKHVADSLMICKVYPEIQHASVRVLDIGCGGGVPGIILAITFPNLLCTEVDSTGKKAMSVHGFIEEMGLDNAEAIQANAFELSHTADYGEQIDLVVARAVGHSAKMINQGRRFLAPGSGRMILYKTPGQLEKEREEVQREVRKKQFKLSAVASDVFELPDELGSRQFWMFEQAGRTRRR